MNQNDDLTRAIDACDLPALIAEFYPSSNAKPGRRGAFKAVWRDDKNPSASLYKSNNGGAWMVKDHASGDAMNAYQFLTGVVGWSSSSAAEELKQRAGISKSAYTRPALPVPAIVRSITQAQPLEPLGDQWQQKISDARIKLEKTEHSKILEHYGLTTAQARDAGLGLDGDGGLLIPIYSLSMELLAIKKRKPQINADKRYSYLTTDRGSPAWISGSINPLTNAVLIVEGEMNGIVAHLCLQQLGLNIAVIGVAGAQHGIEEWAAVLENRDVMIYADNDTAGASARTKWQAQAITAKASSVAQLEAMHSDDDFGDFNKAVGLTNTAARLEEIIAESKPLTAAAIASQKAVLSLGAVFLDLEAPIPSVEWIIESMIPKGRVTSLNSYGGVGKSSVCTHVIACLNTGTDFAGFKVNQQKSILYIDFEDEVDTFRRWMMWSSKGLGVTVDVRGVQYIEAQRAWVGKSLGNQIPDLLVALTQSTVIIIDAFEAAMMIDSNKAQEVVSAMSHLAKLARAGHTVIMLDHLPKIGKGQSRADVMPAGSVQKVNQSRCVMILEDVTPPGYGDGKTLLKFRNIKMNLAKKFEDFGLERHVSNGSATFKVCDLPEPENEGRASPAKNEARAWLLRNISDQTVTLKNLVDASGMAEKTLRRALDDLCDEGRVMQISSNPLAFKSVMN